jgi:glucose-6-phosphate dehydrogenase assembly protein OpcA
MMDITSNLLTNEQ